MSIRSTRSGDSLPQHLPRRRKAPRQVPPKGNNRYSLRFIVPSAVLVAFLFALPFVLNVPFAFSTWSGFSQEIRFIGFSNFRTLWERDILGLALGVTSVYAVTAMILQNVVALPLAYALRRTTRLNSFFRSLFFLPVLISPLAAGYIWRAILEPSGTLNEFLGIVAGNSIDFPWLGTPQIAVFLVAFVDAWKWSGIATLVYIAGINAVPRELLEAAEIDGASGWQRFRTVVFPLLAPAFTFNIVTTLVGALSAYDIVASMTFGGPGTSTTTLNFAVQQEFGKAFFGSAAALSLSMTLLVVLTAVPLVAWLRKRESHL